MNEFENEKFIPEKDNAAQNVSNGECAACEETKAAEPITQPTPPTTAEPASYAPPVVNNTASEPEAPKADNQNTFKNQVNPQQVNSNNFAGNQPNGTAYQNTAQNQQPYGYRTQYYQQPNQPFTPPNPMGGVPPYGYQQPPMNNGFNPGYGAQPQPQPFEIDPSTANPIHYTSVEKPTENKESKKGLKIFCVIMAAVVLLTGGCLTGYFVGNNKPSSGSNLHSNVDVDLASKPKDTDESTPAEVYEQVSPSIVGIRVYNEKGKMADASGVIYTEDGYIITNDHIYSEIGAAKFKVYMHDGIQYDADYVAGDVISDLAVLKIRGGKDFKPAVLGNSEEIFCGENVVAIGRPSNATTPSVITKGIISLTKRRVQTTSSYSARLIQTDSAINPGSSGGALVNMYGQVIGITASKVKGSVYDRIGFAIPTKTVKRVVEQLISDGKVTDRAKLGITYRMADSIVSEINKLNGVGLYINNVTNDSDLKGKLEEGDIITHINGVAATSDDVVLDIIEDCKAGDTITVSVVKKNGSVEEYKAKLKANIGQSSYSKEIDEGDKNESSGGGTFDFPFGE